MLCKKCKTSVLDGETMCSYCQTKVSNVKRNKIITVTVLSVLAVASIAYMYAQPNRNLHNEEILATEFQEVKDAAETNLPEGRTAEVVAENNTETEAQPEAQVDDVWRLLETVMEKVSDYYERYTRQAHFVTRRGYLYDVSMADYITMADLIDVGLIDPKYQDERVLIMYLRPSDIENIVDVKFDSENPLELYCAYETEQGFALSSREGSLGFISRSYLNRLLALYEYEYGEVVRPSYTEKEYGNVLDAIRSYEFNFVGHDVRYMAVDEKYAVAAVSPKNKPAEISQYVLEKSNEIWTIRIANFESFQNFEQEINQNVVDLNFALLPSWNLNEYLHRNNFALQTEIRFDASVDSEKIKRILEPVLSFGISSAVEENDQPVFLASAGYFDYVEYASCKIFILHGLNLSYQTETETEIEESSPNNTVTYTADSRNKIHLVNNFQEAEKKMQELDSNAPLFLIRQK